MNYCFLVEACLNQSLVLLLSVFLSAQDMFCLRVCCKLLFYNWNMEFTQRVVWFWPFSETTSFYTRRHAKRLKIQSYKQNISMSMLPITITSFDAEKCCERNFCVSNLPQTLKNLVLPTFFNQIIFPNDLPNSLIRLNINIYYNQPLLTGSLPNSLTYLRFGFHFNQRLEAGMLPSCLTYLHLGHNFNQPLDKNTFPCSLRKLKMSHNFSHNLEPGVFPSSLTTLKLKRNFQHPCQHGLFPSSLTKLHLSFSSFCVEKNILPCNLKQLTLSVYWLTAFRNAFPSSLTTIVANSSFMTFLLKKALHIKSFLPASLSVLTIFINTICFQSRIHTFIQVVKKWFPDVTISIFKSVRGQWTLVNHIT